MKKLKNLKPLTIILILLLAFFMLTLSLGYAPDQSIPESFKKGIDKIFGGSVFETTPTADDPLIPDEEPDEHTPSWTEVGSGNGWSFVGSNNHQEWSINLGDIRLGTGGTNQFRIEVTRRWNFKDVFECGESTLIWCLHDSADSQIWKQTDSSTILAPGRTDTITSFVLYDGRPWRMFIGNNFACEVDCYWWITIYQLI